MGDGYLAELRDRGVSYVFEGKGDDAFPTAVVPDGAEVFPAIDGLAGVSSVIGYRGASGERPAQGQRLEHIATETGYFP